MIMRTGMRTKKRERHSVGKATKITIEGMGGEKGEGIHKNMCWYCRQKGSIEDYFSSYKTKYKALNNRRVYTMFFIEHQNK